MELLSLVLAMHINALLLLTITRVLLGTRLCTENPLRFFHLVKRCQRSLQQTIELQNVATLDECSKAAKHFRALAFNYSPMQGIVSNLFTMERDSNSAFSFPRRSNRRHFLEQPEEFFNCHLLQCPEGSDFGTMTNDSRFDYYSLYGSPPSNSTNFTCIPQVGIFQLNLTLEDFTGATKQCNLTSRGSLAHTVSETRTNELSRLLQNSGKAKNTLKLAYVGLNYTLNHGRNFKVSSKENLKCFLYRAWAPGHPKRSGLFLNQSCVALTTEKTWMTVDCERKLPYICEVYTSSLNLSLYEDACRSYL